MNPNTPLTKNGRYYTTGKAVFLCALLAFTTPLGALDLSGIAENDAAAFRAAVEAEGGTVNGEACVISSDGPDGKVQRLISFPRTDCFVNLPVDTITATWTMSGSIRVEAMPFGKGAGGGGMFGLHFGPNDAILALSADKWSKLNAPKLFSGATALVPESEFKEADVPQVGSWQKISLGLDGAQWKLKVGDSFEKGGTIENDTRGVLTRRSKLFMRIGNFSGTATVPEISESN